MECIQETPSNLKVESFFILTILIVSFDTQFFHRMSFYKVSDFLLHLNPHYEERTIPIVLKETFGAGRVVIFSFMNIFETSTLNKRNVRSEMIKDQNFDLPQLMLG